MSVAFGCPYDGPVAPALTASVAARLIDLGCDEISLGDTIGAATPGDIRRVLDAVLRVVSATRVGLHAHDTRGQALANVYAALERGITIFDSSAGGLGGCPFAGPGAVGNLATEDLLYFLDGLGIAHGASLEGVIAASAFIEDAVGHPLRSRTYQAGGRPGPVRCRDGSDPPVRSHRPCPEATDASCSSSATRLLAARAMTGALLLPLAAVWRPASPRRTSKPPSTRRSPGARPSSTELRMDFDE